MFIACTALIERNEPHVGHGVAVLDVDNDGTFEFLVTGYGMANRVLKWNGQRLIDATAPTLADPTGLTTCLLAADIDGDGREEIYVCNEESEAAPGSTDRLLTSFGSRWVDMLSLPENAEIAEAAFGVVAACLDRHGRGRYGFAVANAGDPIALYELEARGRIVNAAEEAGLDLTADTRAMTALPLVSERMDLFVHVGSGSNCLFRNLGDGTFEEVAEKRGLADTRQQGRGVAVLDADGNGLFDLACAVRQGSHRLFIQRAGGGFTEEAPADLSLPSHACSVIAADFDNDGFEELLFLNHGQPNRLFALRHEEWREIEIGDAAEPRGWSTGAAVADIDGDGILELLVNHHGHNSHPAPLALFKATAGDNSWLRVLPLTAAGAPARGAVVICTAGTVTRHRSICAGSGYLSQMEPVAHFGLGQVRAVDTVEVHWPDGAIAIIDGPPINRMLTVPHPPE
ncbi:MAG: CRTAC1 family protein [Rhodospirillaceae bacterium]